MPPSLEGPKAKLARADEHLTALHGEVKRFLRTEPYRLRHDVDPQQGDDVWRLEIRESPPLRLSILAGDVIHDLRSSLDHLVWQLSLIVTPTPFERSEFPIYDAEFKCFDINTKKDREGFHQAGRSKIRDVPLAAQHIIESVQPYHYGHAIGDWLWILQELSNRDKHRLPLHALFRQSQIHYPYHWIEHIETSYGVRDDGDEIIRLPRAGRDYDVEIEDHELVEAVCDVAIETSRRPPWAVRRVLKDIHEAIGKELLPQFARFFAELS